MNYNLHGRGDELVMTSDMSHCQPWHNIMSLNLSACHTVGFLLTKLAFVRCPPLQGGMALRFATLPVLCFFPPQNVPANLLRKIKKQKQIETVKFTVSICFLQCKLYSRKLWMITTIEMSTSVSTTAVLFLLRLNNWFLRYEQHQSVQLSWN